MEGKLIPKKLFVVGDFKQAIYGFRGTDSTIFKRVSGDIGESGHKSLNICYRSEREIIKGINEEFFSGQEFIDYIEYLNDNNSNEAEAALDTEDTEAVKIMTIHASKGLEFEAVIVPSIERNVISLSKGQNKKVGFMLYKEKMLSRYNTSGVESKEFMEVLEEKLVREIHEEIRILYVAMTRAKQHIVLTGKDEEYDGDFDLSEENIVENLNTYEKMIKYAAYEGRACLDTISFMSAEELQQIEVQELCIKEDEKLDEDSIRKRVLFKPQIKPRNYASASRYMSYSSCERKYYYENILGGRYEEYKKLLEEKLEDKVADSIVKEKRINATDKGVLVHKVLDYMNKYGNESYENYIEDILEDAYLEDEEKFTEKNDKYEVQDLRNEIKIFVNNYLAIEEKESKDWTYGDLIKSSSEVSYLLAPLQDRKMMINGFVDRLKLYKRGDKIIAVIIDYKTNKITEIYNTEHFKKVYSEQLMIYGKAVKSLLKVDEIILKLYMLHSGEVVSIEYNEDKVNKLMETMDEGCL